MLITAHTGHWMLTVLEASPALVIPAVLGWKIYVDRRRRRDDSMISTTPRS